MFLEQLLFAFLDSISNKRRQKWRDHIWSDSWLVHAYARAGPCEESDPARWFRNGLYRTRAPWKWAVSLRIQAGDEISLLQGRCGSVAQCVRPVLYVIKSPVEPMQGGGDILFSRWIHHIPWTQAALEGFVRRTISVCDFDSSSSVVSLERCGHSTIQMLSSVTPWWQGINMLPWLHQEPLSTEIDRSCGLTLTDNVSTDL